MANSDIIKIGFDYRASLAQFEKDTNGVFDGISNKAGKQKITIQLDAKDDKVIDKIKELQKLKLDKFTFEFGNSGLKEQLQTFDKLENKINEIINIGKGKSFINTSSTVTDIGKIENKINELNKKYEETQKKLSSISSGNISGKDVNLVDNAEFQKLSESFEKIKGEVDDLKTHMSLLDDSVVSGEQFIKLGEQVDGLSVKFDGLIDKYHELSNAQKSLSSATQVESNTSSGTKDAFQSGTATSSVENTTQAIKEQNNILDENIKKYKKSISELIKGRDIVNQNWYREKETVVGKDEKGNDITRNVGQFSFVERLQDGQLQTVLATYNDETGKWAEQVINVRTAFEQVEKAIISADNKINSLTNARNKTLTAHPEYDTTADDNLIAIEQKRRNELKEILNAYGEQERYVYEIEAAEKRILENQIRLQNVSKQQNNLQIAQEQEKSRLEIEKTTIELNKQQAVIDAIERTYNKTQGTNKNPNLDRAVTNSNDLKELTDLKNQIESKISGLRTKQKSNISVELSDVKILIEQYKQLAKDKLKANNPSKQELGGQDLQVLLSQQVSQYNQLIAKAEKYGDATANVVQKLKDERNIIASMNSDNIYVPKSGLTSDNYYQARDNYKINKAEFNSYETSIKKFEEEWAKLVEIDNAISNTQTLLNSLKVPSGFEGSFNNVKSTVESLNKDLENEQITLTEYNSQVKSAFNGFNNSVGEKQTQVWNELNNSLNRYATLQKRIASGNALSTDEKEASDLLNKIYELQRSDILSTENLNHSNERLTQIRQTVEDIKKSAKENTLDSMQSVIDKYKKVFDQRSITPADFNQSDTYKKALGELSSSIKTLEEYKASLSGIDEITDEQKVHIEQLTMECEKCANAFKAMDSSEKGSNEASRYKEVDKLSKYLKENTRLSKEAKQQLEEYLNQLKSGDPNVNVKEIHTEWLKIAEAERMAGREGKSFLDILSTKSIHGFIGQLQSYLSMYVGFYGIVNKIRSTISTVTELDTSLVDLKKTTTMNASELESFYFDSNKVAKQMGATTKEIIEQASAWSRLGYNTKETSTEMAQLSSQFASISPGMDTDEAQSGLVSIMKAEFSCLYVQKCA